jgi:bacillithiol biosynthesis deacetylase BshB1
MQRPLPVDVLAFGPHPDDVELCAGGWMLQLRDQGRRTAVVDVTRGEAATRGTPETRAEEAGRASALMGLAGRENLGLPDGAVEVTADAVRSVVSAIRRWRPRVVLGPAFEDLHPDHVATAGLIQRAYYLSTIGGYDVGGAPPHRPDLLVHYYGHKEPPPTYVVDVSDVWERRRELALCYASQFDAASAEVETNIASPDFFDRMEARFAYWGARIGARYAEPYLADRVVPLDDPVEVFRKRGWAVL